MLTTLRSSLLVFAFISCAHFSAAEKPQDHATMEAATRLQIFLDRAEFGPGKIDGHYGGFTNKALALYRESKGQPPQKQEKLPEEKTYTAPDTSDLDLKTIEPVFISYTVTDSDLQNVGSFPAEIPEQAKGKTLPYADALEAIAEKFHSDKDFLGQLNPALTAPLKAGDQLTVPNVEPFDLNTLVEVATQEETARQEKRDKKKEKAAATPSPEPTATPPPPPPISVWVDTQTNMAQVREADRLIAAYPVTIGSKQTVSPVGDWKVLGIAKMPTFRWDEAMLKHGKRSSDFHMLPSGPNNPVGVMWIELNKTGIGLHGTAEPDAIGRSSSHGCIRFANWDIVRLASKLRPGVPVSIH